MRMLELNMKEISKSEFKSIQALSDYPADGRIQVFSYKVTRDRILKLSFYLVLIPNKVKEAIFKNKEPSNLFIRDQQQ